MLGLWTNLNFGPDPNQRILSRATKIGTPDPTTADKQKMVADWYLGELAKSYNFNG